MNEVYVIAALRTPVMPRGGAFAALEPWELAAPVISALVEETGIATHEVGGVILGNALYGGGNPARLTALAAGLPEGVPAATVDTQCCAGLDAIAMAADTIRAGRSAAFIAGGLESFSRAPLRYRRPRSAGEMETLYLRPPFSPWPDRDPDMADAVAELARRAHVDRAAQETFAIASHRKALAADHKREIVSVAGISRDGFTRRMSPELCARLPEIAGAGAHGMTAATIAVEADAAAAVLLAPAAGLRQSVEGKSHAVRIVSSCSIGGDPAQPALAAVAAAEKLLAENAVAPGDLAVVEIMEAFAAQAIAGLRRFGFPEERINRGGGALARGHPIGASGAILATRMFHELQREAKGALGLAAIAAAGGIGSAMLFERM